jgi:hypothetical protein
MEFFIAWKKAAFLGCALLFLTTGALAQAIKLNPANPHYYLYKGKPTILITSAEHYGSVINKEFDYVTYLDSLKSYRLNYTRIYAGAMFETVGKYIVGNPLGPAPRNLVVPWVRSNVPGYIYGGNKFDLDKWDPAYFERLKDFVAKAGERGVVVEVCFFNAQYSDTWPISPLNAENNIQGVGKCSYQDVQTLKHANLVQRESDYVRKLTRELNAYDNVILEMCDEAPDIGDPPTPLSDAGAWVSHLVDVAWDAERDLPQKHLIGAQVEGPVGGPLDLSGNPKVSVIINQYVWQAGFQMGGMKGLDFEYDHNKSVEFNETDWYPLWYKGDKIADSRVEAWEFIVGGGGSFNHLNGRYMASDPAGNTPDNEQIRSALRSLSNFMASFDFLKMSPDKSFVVGGVPAGAFCRGISEPGKQYALYHHHSKLKSGATDSYWVQPGDYAEDIELELPGGTYKADWVDPATGAVITSEKFTHYGGSRIMTTPKHAVDIALRIKWART